MAEQNNGKTAETEDRIEIKATSVGENGGESDSVEIAAESRGDGADQAVRERRSDRSDYQGGRYGGRGYRDSRSLSNDEKLKIYKKQSEERLLDIKRSREAKIGKRRAR